MAALDVATDTWQIIKIECQKILQESRAVTESPGIDERDADTARGQIAVATRILRLAEPSKLVVVDED